MKLISLTVIIVALLVSCTYNKEELLYMNNTCDTSNIKYSVQVLSALTINCTSCHSGVSSPGGIQLDSYNAVRTNALNGRLLGSITHAPGYRPMPDFSPKIPECRIAEIRTWIRNGAPNN